MDLLRAAIARQHARIVKLPPAGVRAVRFAESGLQVAEFALLAAAELRPTACVLHARVDRRVVENHVLIGADGGHGFEHLAPRDHAAVGVRAFERARQVADLGRELARLGIACELVDGLPNLLHVPGLAAAPVHADERIGARLAVVGIDPGDEQCEILLVRCEHGHSSMANRSAAARLPASSDSCLFGRSPAACWHAASR
ncbi:hypothetical protein D3C86_1575180 [compost metagenome]